MHNPPIFYKKSLKTNMKQLQNRVRVLKSTDSAEGAKW